MVTFDERLNERLGELFTQALQGSGRAWNKALERHLKPHGLTVAGWSAITALADMQRAASAEDARPPSQTALAQQLGVDGATLVSTIDRLTASKLIERIPSRQDRRVKLVVLTQAGRELERKLRAHADGLRREALAHLNPGEVATVVNVLEQWQQVLENA
jgi:MarR family transcriptional regulator, transcriptional regulator for hemolysin